MPLITDQSPHELTSSRFDALVRAKLEEMGVPLVGLPEPEAKRYRALALEKLQVHRRCSFCGQLTTPRDRKPGGPTTGSICVDCQSSSERRKRFGCW